MAGAPVLAVVGNVSHAGQERIEVLVRTAHGHRGAQAITASREPDSRTYFAYKTLLSNSPERIVPVGNDIVSTRGAAFELLTAGSQIVLSCPMCKHRVQTSRGSLVRRWEQAGSRTAAL